MTISITELTNGQRASADTDQAVSASITPGANKLLFYCDVSTDGYILSVSGLGLTWQLVATKFDGASSWLSLFRAKTGSSPGSGAVTGTISTTTDAYWSILEVSGTDISGTAGSTSIVQTAVNNLATPGTSHTVTLGTFTNAGYGTFGLISLGTYPTPTSITPGSGFTEIAEMATDYSLQSQYKTSNDTTVDWSWTGAYYASGIAVELRATGVSPSSSTSPSASVSPSVSPSASSSPSASVSPSVSPSASVSPSSSSSRSVSPSSSVSPSASVSPSVSPSASVSPSSSASPSISPSASVSPSSSNSPSPSVGNSYSMSPSSSVSPSVSPSSSVSPSVSASISPSTSISPSSSNSPSRSPSSSLSPSASSSLSPSLSPSASQSRSISPSHSTSPSNSASLSKSPSPSPSPEPSHNLFTREAIVNLPSGKADLAITYTTPEEGKVAVEDGHRVAVSGITSYLVHQFKRRHTNRSDRIKIRINARTTLAPTTQTVYLQIWNGRTNSWETLDSNSKSGVNEDFNLHGDVSDTSYYDFQNEVCIRIYQNNPII